MVENTHLGRSKGEDRKLSQNLKSINSLYTKERSLKETTAGREGVTIRTISGESSFSFGSPFCESVFCKQI